MAKGLKNKSQKSIWNKIKYLIIREPKELGKCNGGEFINYSINNYMNRNNDKKINE